MFSPTGFEARDSHFSHWDIWTVTCYPQESRDRAKGSLILFLSTPSPPPVDSRYCGTSDLWRLRCQGLLLVGVELEHRNVSGRNWEESLLPVETLLRETSWG